MRQHNLPMSQHVILYQDSAGLQASLYNAEWLLREEERGAREFLDLAAKHAPDMEPAARQHCYLIDEAWLVLERLRHGIGKRK